MPPAFNPVETIAGDEDVNLVFLCDHASNALPSEYGTLGLTTEQLSRHIAWDIGAADVTRALAAHFQAPAVLGRFSRLLIDPNRRTDDPTLVMRLSDGTLIPGNITASPQEIERRRATYWQPYRDAVDEMLQTRLERGIVPAIVSIHSFTDQWRGQKRPWQIGLLWDSDPRFASSLYTALKKSDATLEVGDNEPYDGALTADTMHEFGTLRGLPHVLVELRQDLIATPEDARKWADRISGPLAEALSGDDIKVIRHYPSRAGTGKLFSLQDFQ